MESTLSVVLNNLKLKNEAKEAVRVMLESAHSVLVGAQVTTPCLLDLLSIIDYGQYQRRTPITPQIHQATKDLLLNPASTGEDFSALGVYDMTGIRQLANRRDYISAVRALGDQDHLVDPDIRPYVVEEVSLMANSPTTALAVSNFYLYKGWDVSDHPYYGNIPGTSPVRKWFKRVLNLCSPTQVQINHWTYRIAGETDLTPLMVNTIMWVLGQR